MKKLLAASAIVLASSFGAFADDMGSGELGINFGNEASVENVGAPTVSAPAGTTVLEDNTIRAFADVHGNQDAVLGIQY